MQYPKSVHDHLIKPFKSELAMQQYWLDTGTTLVEGSPPADSVLEYTETLSNGYTISLVINNDTGTYYLEIAHER